MKNFLILISIFLSSILSAQVSGCGTATMCLPFNNTDQFQIYQAIKSNSAVTIPSTISVACNTCVSNVSVTNTPSVIVVQTVTVKPDPVSTFTVRPQAGSVFTVVAPTGTLATTAKQDIANGALSDISAGVSSSTEYLAQLFSYQLASSSFYSTTFLAETTAALLDAAFDTWKAGAGSTLIIVESNVYWDGTKHTMYIRHIPE